MSADVLMTCVVALATSETAELQRFVHHKAAGFVNVMHFMLHSLFSVDQHFMNTCLVSSSCLVTNKVLCR